MAEYHLSRHTAVSVAAIPVPVKKASSFGIMVTDSDGAIREFQEKPRQPAAMPGDPTRAYASMGNYLFSPDVLTMLLEETMRNGGNDFGHHVMPALPGRFPVYAYDFSENRVPGIAPHEERAYWRDVGTVEALLAAQQDVTGARPRFSLYNHAWPLYGGDRGRAADGWHNGFRRKMPVKMDERTMQNIDGRATDSIEQAALLTR
jgi:glucose-1-phosphate adenylyltransferase